MDSLPLAAKKSPAEIARASGSNFLISFLFLTPGRRRALLAVYAFCRVVDDAVDLAREDGSRAREQLAFWEGELEEAFRGEPSTPTGFALHRACERFGLPIEPLRDLCAGVRMDLDPPHYETFGELSLYMHRVASTVGITCLPVFGADPARSRPYAEALGQALQYTNILRDLGEDGDRGRCYLPRAELEGHGVPPDWIRSDPPPEALDPEGPLARLLGCEQERARSLFAKAAELLPPADRRSLRPARIMGSIYRDLLSKVERLGPRVLVRPRVRCPLHRKIFLALFGI